MATVDGEVERLGLTPSLVKVDVEGWELDVLRGAEEVLGRHRPVLLVSVHPDVLEQRGISVAEVLLYLRARGYEPEIVERDHELHVFARGLRGCAAAGVRTRLPD